MKSIQARILWILLPIVLLIFIGTVGYVMWSTYGQAEQQAENYAEAQAERFSEMTLNEIGSGLELAENLAYTFETVRENEEEPDRELLINILGDTLEEHEDMLGIWTVWEPDALDGNDEAFTDAEGHNDDGRFAPYWNRGAEGEDAALEATNTTYQDPEMENSAWYFEPLETGEPQIIEPTVYEVQGEDIMLVSVTYPIIVDGETLGVMGVDFSMDNLQDMVADIELYDSGYGMLVTNEGMVSAHPDEEVLGAALSDTVDSAAWEAAVENGESTSFLAESGLLNAESLYNFIPVNVEGVSDPWTFATVVPTNEITQEADETAVEVAIIAFVLLLILIGAIILLARSISKPVQAVSTQLDQLGSLDLRQGEENVYNKYGARSDEVGVMVRSAERLRHSFTQVLRRMGQTSEQVASSSEELSAVSQQSSTAAEEVANTIEDISKRATEQSDATERGSSEMQLLGEHIDESISGVQQLQEAAERITAAKDQGSTAIGHLTTAAATSDQAAGEAETVMKETEAYAAQISKATDVIQEIAEQTNLLALNASIEAARAGEAGSGFAVVADEIRKLAEQSRNSTEEINGVVQSLNTQMQSAVASMNETKAASAEQSEQVSETEEAFREVAEAIREMEDTVGSLESSSSGVIDKKEEIVALMNKLSSMAQENAAGTEEASASIEEQTASMEEIASSSESLATLAEDMQNSVEQFSYDEEAARTDESTTEKHE
ncbi:methyl-accepting chemotaxis sensory transducer with Cache sensor [Salsuginibacillus halophilus]|uniref:Methyl-accepting chemotaxis sensory transducer with Cache sensor n=1 Tax=Salsuginibacillus halophilus TaxID=517424 RepID=A0A2P8HDV8_9BACI|nr:methyl-accepting chemotaxis protein [Salsuginibacillus halophilus]PSL44403.1 methyl-accepting chemotaxis sensory transducer with Cache sensor [Salsuginibacillus halophilus]